MYQSHLLNRYHILKPIPNLDWFLFEGHKIPQNSPHVPIISYQNYFANKIKCNRFRNLYNLKNVCAPNEKQYPSTNVRIMSFSNSTHWKAFQTKRSRLYKFSCRKLRWFVAFYFIIIQKFSFWIEIHNSQYTILITDIRSNAFQPKIKFQIIFKLWNASICISTKKKWRKIFSIFIYIMAPLHFVGMRMCCYKTIKINVRALPNRARI